MEDKDLIKLVQQIERTLSQIYTKGNDSFLMVASINSLHDVIAELSKRNDGR